MKGKPKTLTLVQTHLRNAGVPPKVRLALASDGIQVIAKNAGGVVEEIEYTAIVRLKKLVDGLGLELATSSNAKKTRTIKLECPERGAALYQALQNKLHEVHQATRQRRVAQHFHVLWDRIDEAVDRVRGGFDNLKQLVKFVQKRANAEREYAAKMLEMCVPSSGLGGALGRAGSIDLLDLLTESGKVNEGACRSTWSRPLDFLKSASVIMAAWAVIVAKTRETAHGHQATAERLHDKVLLPLEQV